MGDDEPSRKRSSSGVVIKAKRGLGRTRPVLEFHKWRREGEDGWLTESSWPDAAEISVPRFPSATITLQPAT